MVSIMRFRLHPITIFYTAKSYWYVFSVPIVRIVAQYVLLNIYPRLFMSEIAVFFIILLFAVLKWHFDDIELHNDTITLKSGLLIKKLKTINVSKLLSIVVKRNFFDLLFGSASCYFNIESDAKGTNNICVRLSKYKAKLVCEKVYGNFANEKIEIERKKGRYFTIPTICIVVSTVIALSWVLLWRNKNYTFVPIILLIVSLYYFLLCYHNYKHSKLEIGNIVFVKGTREFGFYSLYCLKNSLQYIRTQQTPKDRRHGTCSAIFLSGCKVGDTLRIKKVVYRNLLASIK